MVRPGWPKGVSLLMSVMMHLGVAMLLLPLAWQHRPKDVPDLAAMTVSIRMEAPPAPPPAADAADSSQAHQTPVPKEARASAAPPTAKPARPAKPGQVVRRRVPQPDETSQQVLPQAAVSEVAGAGASSPVLAVPGEETAFSSAPAMPSGSLGGTGDPASAESMRAWLEGMQRRIQDRLIFPTQARKLGLGGRSRVRIRILADGSLDETALAVVGGTGFDVLDAAALASVRAAAPFAPPPSAPVEVEVPVAFTIVRP